MPPSTASTKNSPRAAVVGPTREIGVKDVDEDDTHTSGSVCSSSGTDADTTVTTSSGRLAMVAHPPCLTAHAALTGPARHTTRMLADLARSPTSPMPCDFPEDFAGAVRAPTASATMPLGHTSSAEHPVRAAAATSPATFGSAKKTPAPPPPIDFCGPAKRPASALRMFMPPSLSQNDRAESAQVTSSEAGVLSPVSVGPDGASSAVTTAVATACVSPVMAGAEIPGGANELRPPASPSVLHAYSEPFYPLDRSGPAQRLRLEGNASLRTAISPMSIPHHGYAPSINHLAMERPAISPCTVDFGVSDEPRGGLQSSPTRSTPGYTRMPVGSTNVHDLHWQDIGANAYYSSSSFPFTHGVSNSETDLGGGHSGGASGGMGGPLTEDGYGCTSMTAGGGGAMLDGLGRTPDSPSYSNNKSMIHSTNGESNGSRVGTLPSYGELPRPFFRDGGSGYDGGGFGEQEMHFGYFVPQAVRCVEQLDDLDYICRGILTEAAAVQQQQQRRCRARRYSADNPCNIDDERESRMVIALDLEGRSLGRSGSICIITLATYSTVYIIDMVLLGAQALDSSSALKTVLESCHITKLMFDCRADCDALFFLYNVRLRNVCDLQISSCFALFPMARHLPSMKDVFRVLGLFAEEDTDIKNAGRDLFNPESGGSFDRWEERPLTGILLQYCAVDVKYFFLAKLMLWDHLHKGFWLGEARLASVCAGNFVGCSKGNSLRDFEMS